MNFRIFVGGNLTELISEKCPGEYTGSSRRGSTDYYSKGFSCDLGQIHASGFYCNGYDSPKDGVEVKLDMSVSQFLELISPLIFIGWADIVRGSDYNFWFKGEKKKD